MSDSSDSSLSRLSIAAEAMRRGVVALARSFRLHRQRGGFCHRGWCQQCRVTLDDGHVVLACQTPHGDASPNRPRSLGRIAGSLAEHAPPWFYESHFLRPRALRQFYLNCLRHLSAAPALPANAPDVHGMLEELDCEVLVVGGGLAGLASATTLAKAGRVVVLVEAEALGGSAQWAAGFADAVPRAIEEAKAGGVECRIGALCVGLYRDPDRALCVARQGGAITVRFKRLVIATGAYDRLPLVPGNDLPGVIGMRALERLAAQRAITSSARIGIYGDAVEVGRALRAASASGIRIEWIAGPGGLPEATCVAHPGVKLERLHGRWRVRVAELAKSVKLACDLLVLGQSQPTYELQAQWGLQPSFAVAAGYASAPPVHDDQPLVIGEAAGSYELNGLANQVTEATNAWIDARRYVTAAPADAMPAAAERPSQDAFVCLCEDVRVRDVARAIDDGYRDVELIKRHCGVGTGPCQGKLCHASLMQCLVAVGLEPRLPTPRPLVRPVPLACFGARVDD
jgi:sarcosine oxidase subunit alpha